MGSMKSFTAYGASQNEWGLWPGRKPFMRVCMYPVQPLVPLSNAALVTIPAIRYWGPFAYRAHIAPPLSPCNIIKTKIFATRGKANYSPHK